MKNVGLCPHSYFFFPCREFAFLKCFGLGFFCVPWYCCHLTSFKLSSNTKQIAFISVATFSQRFQCTLIISPCSPPLAFGGTIIKILEMGKLRKNEREVGRGSSHVSRATQSWVSQVIVQVPFVGNGEGERSTLRVRFISPLLSSCCRWDWMTWGRYLYWGLQKKSWRTSLVWTPTFKIVEAWWSESHFSDSDSIPSLHTSVPALPCYEAHVLTTANNSSVNVRVTVPM